MPKRKQKISKNRVDDDVEILDNASVISLCSDGSEAIAGSHTDSEEITSVQSLLEKVTEASDALTEKRPEVRIKSLKFLLDAFRKNYLCLDESWNYINTFIFGIESVLKRGRPSDQALAAECLSVFSLQFDTQNMVVLFTKFWPILDTISRDVSSPCLFRAACIVTISVLQFITGPCDIVSPIDIMKNFETIFKGSCLKGDGKPPVLEAHVYALHVTALKAWGLLFTFLQTFNVGTMGKAIIPTLLSLLQSTNVDMRIAAGETAALVYERIRNEVDERYKGCHYTDLVSLLNDLATDGDKSRSKIDRKKQRHSFRDLVDVISRFEVIEMTVNFGSETLILSSCSEQLQYDLLCRLLKGGLSIHFQENCLIRDLFSLGPPIATSTTLVDRRSARNQRRLVNSIASKTRTQKLNSHRDRRNNIANESD